MALGGLISANSGEWPWILILVMYVSKSAQTIPTPTPTRFWNNQVITQYKTGSENHLTEFFPPRNGHPA